MVVSFGPHIIIRLIFPSSFVGSLCLSTPTNSLVSSSKMECDLFNLLPSEIIINILSRLPVLTVVTSKCVCKPWLELLETDEFINSHFAKSVPSMVVFSPALTLDENSSWCTVFDLEEEIDIDQSHECRFNPLTKIVFPHNTTFVGSANGFLCLCKDDTVDQALYIHNLSTREYVEVCYPHGYDFRSEDVTYGFGMSKITGELKVLRMSHKSLAYHGTRKLEYRVYTLGTGLWRSVEVDFWLDYSVARLSRGAFVNGCLHWIVLDLDGTPMISCFDLETECFSTFLVPPTLQGRSRRIGTLCVLKDRLCLCDSMSTGDIVIWLMNDCGIRKSWSKEYVIAEFAVNQVPDFNCRPEYKYYVRETVRPIKVFKDGDILMLSIWHVRPFLYYSNKTKTIHRTDILDDPYSYMIPTLLTPSFVSLKSFGMENVVSL